ncbi:hypothetical protein PghCCS26_20330 [Paenibacillus glycanilyticus]|uniref:Uncharacterized protein n=1 Tax=Paenibacillus glycanilyticus TaxID=126569 RepID=A0ABQ6NK36_9BACL|nr:hypothetical protein [Paenibacillus glycanilyticus]GMK44905.1 hypothetical protein PghCCS26_20330 [Paenibacillus glycanilyticus]
MKKFIITAASAAMLFAVPLAASADPGTETKTVTVQPTYEEITPLSLLLDAPSTVINGQGYPSFKYNTSTPENVRTFIQNVGTTTITYKLKDPSGNIWQSGTLTAGQSYQSTYSWTSAQNGQWTWEINQNNGLQATVKLTVRSDV